MSPDIEALSTLINGLRMHHWDEKLPCDQLHLNKTLSETDLQRFKSHDDAAIFIGPRLEGAQREQAIKRAEMLIETLPLETLQSSEYPLLQQATGWGLESLVALMLRRGLRIGLDAALASAGLNGHSTLVELLLTAGADAGAHDHARHSPLGSAANRGDERGLNAVDQMLQSLRGRADFEDVVRGAIPFADGPMRALVLNRLRAAVGTDVRTQRPRAKGLKVVKGGDPSDLRDTQGWLVSAFDLAASLVTDELASELARLPGVVQRVDVLRKGVWLADRNLYVLRLKGQRWTLLIENLEDYDRGELAKSKTRAETLTRSNACRAIIYGGNHNHEDVLIYDSGSLVAETERDLQSSGTEHVPGEEIRMPAIAWQSVGDALQLLVGGGTTADDFESAIAIEFFSPESLGGSP
jgi:hypothetical protein